MTHFNSPYGVVTLTDERKQHIFTFHPDVRNCLQYFALTLSDPEYEISSIHDPLAVICYRFIPKRRKWLAVVVKRSPRPFILTAYLAKKPKKI